VKNTNNGHGTNTVYTYVWMMVDGEQVMRCGLLAAGTNQLCYVRTYDGETAEHKLRRKTAMVCYLLRASLDDTMSKIRRKQERQ
jgi:hypothetical protein